MDRFLLRISLGYPGAQYEVQMLESQQIVHPLEEISQVVEVDDLLQAQSAVKRVHLADEIKRYIVDLVASTRDHPELYLGASPRGSLALFRSAQVKAALAGRDYVLPDDVKDLAVPALAHRLIVGSAARVRDVDARELIKEIQSELPVPGGELVS